MSGPGSACSNSNRGVFGGGSAPTLTNVIGFVTIATLGNAQDFGDLITLRRDLCATSSPTRGVFAAGYQDPSGTRRNEIEYITITSIGNAIDFGDLTAGRSGVGACSNGHGGL